MQAGQLCFGLYDELYVIDMEQVMYFQADDHYSHVYYASGAHFMLPFGLAKVEEAIAGRGDGDGTFVRLGRKYIVNMRRIFHISTMKQILMLSDNSGNTLSIHVPKPVLRTLIETLRTH